ncbi:MAG: SAM-dependent chlorinase/fluorinase [Candidatus Lokiarchaeota archaeon]|nr:SAM-dependent chlorinase/fluorinase [Candidatus Lokiarchaeota archaeon]
MKDYKKRIVALITDFGIKGAHYVAMMKAIIYKINPLTNIIDISHSVSPFSIIEASYILKSSYSYFPKGTIFIIVVDPGVGSNRDIIILQTKDNYYFIGPDNGIFTFVYDQNITHCYKAKNENFFHKPVSGTFHGRDIMAPIAAHIAKNVNLNEFGPQSNIVDLNHYPLLYKNINNKEIVGIIQYIDAFGNAITNIKIKNNHIISSNIHLVHNQKIKIYIDDKEYCCIYTSYFEAVPENTLLIIKGSTEYLEISINKGNASNKLNIFTGDNIKIKFN